MKAVDPTTGLVHTPRMTKLPSPDQAWAQIADRIQPLVSEEVELPSALGRRLRGTVTATWDHPRADLSAMDGYAYAGEVESGAVLREVAEIAAGDEVQVEVQEGTAVAIMTGGWVPPGADRVVPFENCTSDAEGEIRIRKPVGAGANIRRRGEVHAAGTTLIAEETLLDAVHLGVAASEGYTRLEVVRQPRVDLLVTGNEVLRSLPASGVPEGALLDSHTPLLTALCRQAGIDPYARGVAGDCVAELESHLRSTDADLMITTGGVSAGRHDLVPDAAAEAGFEVLVHGVAMQPGKPLLVGVRSRPGASQQWLIGLPGNPAAVFVGFHVFVAPLLRRLAGESNSVKKPFRVSKPLRPHAWRTRYLPGVLADAAGSTLEARTPVGSHDLAAWASAEFLVVLAPGPEVTTRVLALPL